MENTRELMQYFTNKHIADETGYSTITISKIKRGFDCKESTLKTIDGFLISVANKILNEQKKG